MVQIVPPVRPFINDDTFATASDVSVASSESIKEFVQSSVFSGPGQIKALERAQRTSGNVILNSTTAANIDTGLDITLGGPSNPILANDELEVGISAIYNNENVQAMIDVATIVSGSVVNYVGPGLVTGGAADGLGFCFTVGAVFKGFGGSQLYTIQSGDISSDAITVRLRYRTATAANKTLLANSGQRFTWYAKVFSGN